MKRILLLATTTGYQTRAFGDAATRLGIELVFATDRCHLIDDPWQDHAIPIRFYDENSSVTAILESAAARPIDGLIVVGDRPTVIAARVADRMGLPWHSPDAAVVARHKLLTHECLRDAGLPVPWFTAVSINEEPPRVIRRAESYPCVLKPVALSGSRGVMRSDDAEGLAAAFARLQSLMRQPEVQAERDDAHASALIEGFIPGREYALEGLMTAGTLQTLAIFDKPDPLDGPFFEETLYVTPSRLPETAQRAVVAATQAGVAALGLSHGPVHAELRVDQGQVWVLEIAPRSIGGLCSRALRFGADVSLEELILRHGLGQEIGNVERETAASGVMMIPIPARGRLDHVAGLDRARAVPGVTEVRITIPLGQPIEPLPEGARYLGFIFARGSCPAEAENALREAHRNLSFAIQSIGN